MFCLCFCFYTRQRLFLYPKYPKVFNYIFYRIQNLLVFKPSLASSLRRVYVRLPGLILSPITVYERSHSHVYVIRNITVHGYEFSLVSYGFSVTGSVTTSIYILLESLWVSESTYFSSMRLLTMYMFDSVYVYSTSSSQHGKTSMYKVIIS